LFSQEIVLFVSLLVLCVLCFRFQKSGTAVPGIETGPPRLAGIQAARGFAALLVTVYHFERLTVPEQYLGYKAFGGLFSFGHVGVDFFFVLSGFIIYYVHHRDIGNPAALPNYLWRRAARIYPAYWFVTGLAILSTVAVVPDWTGRFELQHLLGSLLLVPQAKWPVLEVGWTLVYEALFYLIFAVGIASQRAGQALFLGWIAVIGACMFGEPENVLLLQLSAYLNLLFMMGLVAAHIVLRRNVRRPLLWALGGLCVLLVAGYIENHGGIGVDSLAGRMTYGFSSMAIIVGLAVADRRGLLRVNRFAMLLGDMSYTLYLIHVLVIANGLWLLAKLGLMPDMPVWALAVGAILGAVAMATVVHQTIERPAAALARRAHARRIVPAVAAG
jgi:peptidoglycan/LPS O-acetylase OafA/YrhL